MYVCLLPVLVVAGAVLGLIDSADGQYYASKYDHIDVDAILNNRRIVNYYAACLLSKGPCPPEGVEFKRILPEALRTNCHRCTEKQKTVTLRAIRRLKKEYPKVWAQLEGQWDPDGGYISKFESTFGAKPSESTAQSVQIVNRFASPDNDNQTIDNTVSRMVTMSSPSSTSTSTVSSTVSSTTTSKPTPTKTTTTTTTTTSTVSSKTVPVTKATTRRVSIINTIIKQNINTISATTKPTKRPRPSIGQSIQATVSLGTNIMGDLVRGLGALGNRVVETGAEIAGVVLKNIARPL